MPAKSRKKTTPSARPWVIISILLFIYIGITYFFEVNIQIKPKSTGKDKKISQQKENDVQNSNSVNLDEIARKVLPEEGIEIPIKWGDLGKQMVDTGVIDVDKFRQLFGGNLTEEQEAMLSGSWNNKVIMNNKNSRFILDLLWALGLGNKNAILENGDMTKKEYGGAGNFASTGGWTLANGNAMDHYSKHKFITLTDEQQARVEKISKGIYRPCCGNSTYFPDCNHGMAMLGLLELMASQGASEDQIYKTALEVNSIWFPDTYINLATYFKEQGQNWSEVSPKTILEKEYSSAQGYRATRGKIKSLPPVQKGGGGCGA